MRGIIIYCHSCTNWEWDETIRMPDGSRIYPGHCGLYSIDCINKVSDASQRPPDYQSLEDSY